MEAWLEDLRFALRTLGKSPGLAAAVVVTLALGIGASTAVFSVVSGVLLRALPYPEADRILTVWETKKTIDRATVSPPNYVDWRARSASFDGLAAFQLASLNLSGDREPERLVGATVTADFFRVMGMAPRLGRGLQAGEDRPGSDHVVVLGDGFWRRRFAGDPGIVGRAIAFDGEPYTVVGVMPAAFRYPERAEVWVPRVLKASELTEEWRHARVLRVIGRLKPGVSLARARAEMTLVARRLERQYPAPNTGWGVNLVPLGEQMVGDVRRALLVLAVAVGLVLLVACANVVNLLLARATVRRREIAVRVALGAGRRRLLRQLLGESLLLALAGGAGGVVLAFWGVRLLLALEPGKLPRVSEIAVDGPVLAFALAVSLAAGLLCGLAPALRSCRAAAQPALAEGGARSAGGGRSQRLRDAVVIVQCGLVLVLLIGAALLVKSFARLTRVAPGFATADRAELDVALPPARYPQPAQQGAFFRQVLERLRGNAAVLAAGVVTTLPLSPPLGYYSFLEGRPVPAPGEEPTADYDSVSPDYFRAMGIPLRRGRAFTAADNENGLPVLVVNETMARQFWPGEDALGKRVSFDSPHGPWIQVVGIVGDVKHSGLDSEPRPAMYYPYLKTPWATMSLVVHAPPGGAARAVAAARAAVWSVDRQQPIAAVRRLDELLSESVARQRFAAALLGLFAALALVLAAIGIYGVVSYSVAQRVREIGIRMALGARRREVLRLVLARALAPVGLGVAWGLAAAAALGRLLASLLFEVSAGDPAVYAAVALMLLCIAGIAAFLPARQAIRIDPLTALRPQ